MIQSITRALDILDYLAAAELSRQPCTLQQVAEHLGVASTTARNILRTMVDCGYARQDAQRRYRLGWKCRSLRRAAAWGGGLVDRAAPIVQGLALETGESVVLAALLQGRRHVILRAEGQSAVRADVRVDESDCVFRLVTGRVLAAHASPEELDAILQRGGYPGEQWGGAEDREALDALLSWVREVGLAEDKTHSGDIWAMAAPVLEADGELVAALGLYLPAYRADEDHLRELRAALLEAARQIALSTN